MSLVLPQTIRKQAHLPRECLWPACLTLAKTAYDSAQAMTLNAGQQLPEAITLLSAEQQPPEAITCRFMSHGVLPLLIRGPTSHIAMPRSQAQERLPAKL